MQDADIFMLTAPLQLTKTWLVRLQKMLQSQICLSIHLPPTKSLLIPAVVPTTANPVAWFVSSQIYTE